MNIICQTNQFFLVATYLIDVTNTKLNYLNNSKGVVQFVMVSVSIRV